MPQKKETREQKTRKSNGDSSPLLEKPYDPSAPPIEEQLRELAKDIPQEEWDNLPSDLIENLDHYIYGTPKK
jgi:hypothetical protein